MKPKLTDDQLWHAIVHEFYMYKYGPDFRGGTTSAETHANKIMEFIKGEEKK